MVRMVECVKLGRTLPALERQPFSGPLGERIFNEVSAEGYALWLPHMTTIINHYGLIPGRSRNPRPAPQGDGGVLLRRECACRRGARPDPANRPTQEIAPTLRCQAAPLAPPSWTSCARLA